RLDSAGNTVSVIAACRFGEVEFQVGNSLQAWSVTPTATSLDDGDAIAVRVYYDDAGGTANSSGTVSFTLDGPTAGVGGDSFVRFTDPIIEKLVTPTYTRTFTA